MGVFGYVLGWSVYKYNIFFLWGQFYFLLFFIFSRDGCGPDLLTSINGDRGGMTSCSVMAGAAMSGSDAADSGLSEK